tara:strand:- start:54 stop:545 length:492 start_codon:yes stop_codon:yes gene_type:complete
MKYNGNGNKIEYKGMLINFSEAKEYSISNSNEAYFAFSKAKKINNWNLFWAALAGYEIGLGLGNLAIYGSGVGFIQMGIGGGLIAMIASRVKKQRIWIKNGTNAFNKSIGNELQPQKKQFQQTQNPYNKKSKTERLLDLKKLFDTGVLTQEEFNSEKKKILNE